MDMMLSPEASTKLASRFQQPHPPEVRQAARELYERGIRVPAIASELHLPVATVYKWSSVGKWQKPMPNVQRAPVATIFIEPKPPREGSEAVRAGLAKTLKAQVDELSRERFSVSGMRNSRASQGLAAVAKTIAETAAIVFDWKSDNRPGMLVVSGATPKPAHNIQAIVTPTPAPEPSKACLPDPTPTPADP